MVNESKVEIQVLKDKRRHCSVEGEENWQHIAGGLFVSWFVGLLFRCFGGEEEEEEEEEEEDWTVCYIVLIDSFSVYNIITVKRYICISIM